MLDRLCEIDLRLSKMIVVLRLHSRLRPIAKILVQIGDGWFWIPVVCLIYLERPRSESFEIIRQSLIALGVSLAFYGPLKLTVRRPRPFQLLTGGTTEVSPIDKFSFPSGHTMNNLAIGLVVAHFFPSLFWAMLLLPIIWGLLRVYFGLHFLSDVVAGGLLGILSFRISAWVASGLWSHLQKVPI
jgi:undecaprenyl-diphosphatase